MRPFHRTNGVSGRRMTILVQSIAQADHLKKSSETDAPFSLARIDVNERTRLSDISRDSVAAKEALVLSLPLVQVDSTGLVFAQAGSPNFANSDIQESLGDKDGDKEVLSASPSLTAGPDTARISQAAFAPHALSPENNVSPIADMKQLVEIGKEVLLKINPNGAPVTDSIRTAKTAALFCCVIRLQLNSTFMEK